MTVPVSEHGIHLHNWPEVGILELWWVTCHGYLVNFTCDTLDGHRVPGVAQDVRRLAKEEGPRDDWRPVIALALARRCYDLAQEVAQDLHEILAQYAPAMV